MAGAGMDGEDPFEPGKGREWNAGEAILLMQRVEWSLTARGGVPGVSKLYYVYRLYRLGLPTCLALP